MRLPDRYGVARMLLEFTRSVRPVPHRPGPPVDRRGARLPRSSAGIATRVAIAAAILPIVLLGCSSTQGIDERRAVTREFVWQYGGRTYKLALDLHADTYETFRHRERRRDYDLFASDYFSKRFIKDLTRKLARYGTASGLHHSEIPYFITSFVQNLPYTADDVTTGYDEYPRFPYETLYDNGGDCEDTSILASAMLHELRYEVALLHFPGHVAVGFACRPAPGQPYYRHHGTRYCYLETTVDDWGVGVVPPSIQGAPVTVKPIIKRPVLLVEFIAEYRQLIDSVAVDVTASVKNLGSETAHGATVYVALRKPGTHLTWDQTESDRFRLAPEESVTYEASDLHVDDGKPFQVYVLARGRNFHSEEAISTVLP